jgi:hypothetical protein
MQQGQVYGRSYRKVTEEMNEDSLKDKSRHFHFTLLMAIMRTFLGRDP